MKRIKYALVALMLLSVTYGYSGESEDSLIVTALYFEVNNPQEAAKVWKKLFETTNKEQYLIEYFNSSLRYKNIKDVIAELKNVLKKKKSQELYNLLASLYVKNGNSKSAIDILSQDTTKLDNETLYQLAYLYSLNNLNDDALKIYKQIYNRTKSWDALKGILSVLSKENRKDEIIDRLWSEINSNDKLPNEAILVFIGLLDFKKDTDRAIFAYNKLYERTNNPDYIKQMISLYLYKKDNKDLINLLEKTHYDDQLLYELYMTNNSLDKAYKLLVKLYDKTKDPKYIAEKAILTYEIANKYKAVDNNILKEMSSLFDEAFSKGVDDDMYYNYYGYILIDSGYNIPKGVEYIQKALEKDPDNVYYLDSLAWGNYKLKRCKVAKSIADKITSIEQNIKEKDILEHIKAIDECNHPATASK